MPNLIYRSYEILDANKSYSIYDSEDKLIRIFSKDEATIEDVYKHIDSFNRNWLMRKEDNVWFKNTGKHW